MLIALRKCFHVATGAGHHGDPRASRKSIGWTPASVPCSAGMGRRRAGRALRPDIVAGMAHACFVAVISSITCC